MVFNFSIHRYRTSPAAAADSSVVLVSLSKKGEDDEASMRLIVGFYYLAYY